MSDMFLTKEEVVELTGWKNKKKQVEQLRKMGLPFWVNARDAPIIPRSAIEGRREAPQPAKRVKVVPLLFRADLQPADRVEQRIQPAIRKK